MSMCLYEWVCECVRESMCSCMCVFACVCRTEKEKETERELTGRGCQQREKLGSQEVFPLHYKVHSLGGRHSTAVAFKLRAPAARVQFSAPDIFPLLRFNDRRTA